MVTVKSLLAQTAAASVCGLVLVLAPPAQAQVASSKVVPNKYVYPLAPAPVKDPVVTVDISDDPDAKEWAAQAQKLAQEWFPLLWRMMGTEGVTPPSDIKLVFKKKISAPAYAAGNEISINGEWIKAHPDDLGMVIHELTHIVQRYPGGGNKPGWLVEGIADYIRWWRYEPEGPRSKIDPLKNSYRDSYRITAAFLSWVSGKYDKGLVPKLDSALRKGTYSESLWKDYTGKDIDTLWSEFAPKPAGV